MWIYLKHFIMRCLSPRMRGLLRSWKMHRVLKSFRHRKVRHNYGATPLTVMLTDPLGVGWYDHDWEELPEILLLKRYQLREGAIVFDLGAHQGIVAIMLAQEIGGTGKVIALEPNYHNIQTLIENCKLNDRKNITAVQEAVSDYCGHIDFNIGLNGQVDDGTGESGRCAVKSSTIDSLSERYGAPNVLFLDLEGMECARYWQQQKRLDRSPMFLWKFT